MKLVRQSTYLETAPFPHAVIDHLFPPGAIMEAEKEFLSEDHPAWQRFSNSRELKSISNDLAVMGPFTKGLLATMCEPEIVDAIGEMAGISRLIPDLHGGGMHLVPKGGKLGVHTDFNRGINGYRRINALLFLNSNWDPAWGGNLELWAIDRSRSVSVLPIANRLVIFTSSSRSFHGHPHPLRCPPDRSRKSLAVYYFTKEPPVDVDEPRDTIFLDV